MVNFIKYHYFEIVVAIILMLPVTGFVFGTITALLNNPFGVWTIPFSLFAGLVSSFFNLIFLGFVPYSQIGGGDTNLWPLNIIGFFIILFYLMRQKRKELSKIPKAE